MNSTRPLYTECYRTRICSGWRRIQRATWREFHLFLSRQGTDRALISLVFCFSPLDQLRIVSCYCQLGKLKAREELCYARPIRMFHSETKAFLSFQLKSLLVPTSPTLFVSERTSNLEIYRRSYISHGDDGGMAPTHLPPPPPPPLSYPHPPLPSANDNNGLLRTTRRRQLLHSVIPPDLQVTRTPPLRRLWCCGNPLGPSIQIMWRMHDHPVLCTSHSTASLVIWLLIPIQSPDCQKRHWASHKTICQHTASQMSTAKQQPMGGQYDENVVKNLRKFTSAHQELLNWAVFQALQLKRVPANIRQQALIVELDYHPNAPDSLHRYANLVILTDRTVRLYNPTLNLASPSRELTSFLGHMSLGPIPTLPPIFSDETIGAGGTVVSVLLSSPSNAAACHK